MDEHTKFRGSLMTSIIKKTIEREKKTYQLNSIALQEYCKKEGKNIDALLLDEDKAKEIIELGLEQYKKIQMAVNMPLGD